MDEAVFVADLQTGDPPVARVGMIAVSDMDRAPAAHAAFVLVIEVLQAMEIVQVPFDRGFFAVNFKRKGVLGAGGGGGWIERGKASRWRSGTGRRRRHRCRLFRPSP